MKSIVIINGHPNKNSFNYALSTSYFEGASSSNTTISQINITDLTFNPSLEHGYQQRMELEPDLQTSIEKIKNADHIVWVYPTWWGGFPGIMKGFIDRTFLPGIVFQPIKGKPFPKQLLKGKTARIIVTSDTPRWYDYLVLKSPGLNQLKKGVLGFCGVKSIKVTYIGPLKTSKKEYREKYLIKVNELGKSLK